MKSSVKLTCIMAASLIGASITHADSKLSVTSQAGFDSNPYRFNDQFTIDSASFIGVDINGKTEINKYWSIHSGLDYQSFDDKTLWADNYNLDLSLGYEKGGYYNSTGIDAQFKQHSKTYVSRLQGSTDTYSGVSLDDRYNYNQIALSGHKSVKIKKGLRNTITADYKYKDYSNFDQISITDYDYQSFKIKDEVTYRSSKRVHQYFSIAYELRPFLNREQKDISGDEIVNTDMVFNYASAGYKYELKNRKAISWTISADLKSRTDNGSGYYDSVWTSMGVASKFKVGKLLRMKLSYNFNDFSFDRQPAISSVSNEEEFVDESKHKFSAEGKVRLPKILDQRTYLEIDYQFTQADSNRSNYQYDRHTVMTGLKLVI